MHESLSGRRKRGAPTKAKATEMLHNPPGGKSLSDAQRGYFGAVASGASPKKAHKKRKRGGRY